MMILNIAIGLVGLGVVVFIHELGHLLSAKAVGIDVEAFSLGWGRKLVGVSWRGTEYRISVFPLGGYCKMKGEQSYTKAVEQDAKAIDDEPGSFFAARPWRRIVTLFAGPLANLLFAIAILTVVWWIGFTVETFPNRIVLASEFVSDAMATAQTPTPAPADRAGLRTGDTVESINGRVVRTYADLQQIVAQNALKPLGFVVRRNGASLTTTVTPELVPETGAGRIGVFAWVDPVIADVADGSAAAAAGLAVADVIESVDGVPVSHTMEVGRALAASSGSVEIVVRRAGDRFAVVADPGRERVLGVAFATLAAPTPDYSFFAAVGRGVTESLQILTTSVRSLRLLFQGVELTSAVAGPVRISYFIGDVTTAGLSIGVGAALRSLFNFLALLSVVLFFMNLLPIPVLDGGQIVLATVEWVRGRAAKPRTVYRYQMVGSALILVLLVFAVFGDILFLAGR